MRQFAPLVLLLVLFTGCSRDNEKETTKSPSTFRPSPTYSVPQAQALVDAGKTEDAAEHYTAIGELLIVPKGLSYADEMFEKALSYDSENVRANLLSALIKPWLVFQSFDSRVKSLEKLSPKTAIPGEISVELRRIRNVLGNKTATLQTHPRMAEYLSKLPEKAAGGNDGFKSYSELQRYLNDIALPVIEKAAARAAKVAALGRPVRLSFDAAHWGRSENDAGYSCETRSFNKWQRDTSTGYYRNIPTVGWECTRPLDSMPAPIREITVDAHDAQVLKSILLGMATQIRLFSAYNVDDLHLLAQDLGRAQKHAANKKRSVSTQKLVEIIRSKSNLLTLKPNHRLREITDDTRKIVGTMLDIALLEKNVCDRAYRLDNLFTGICVLPRRVPLFQTALDMLAGPKVVDLGYDLDGNAVEILVDLRALISQPVSDLKSLLPTEFNARGEPIGYADASMGGLFPNKDLFEKLKSMGHKSVKNPNAKLESSYFDALWGD